jgi:2-keto-3-deoxy-L-rhamnonate aldolase RhmA
MRRMRKPLFSLALIILVLGLLVPAHAQRPSKHKNALFDLWAQGKPAFGVFVPNENPAARGQGRSARGAPRPKPVYSRAGGEKLAANPLYDYVFLNLEGSYDAEAIEAIAAGLRGAGAVSRKTLIVRIPPYHEDPAASATRIKEAFDAGADGVTVPHVQSVDEARRVLSAFEAANVDVWSPSNPAGDKIAMLMIEDRGALAQVKAFADLGGISVLACGIGSMTQALGGDRQKGEQATQTVLAETRRVNVPNMIKANAKDVEQRIKEGFLALLMQGAQADEAIKIGRAAAGR